MRTYGFKVSFSDRRFACPFSLRRTSAGPARLEYMREKNRLDRKNQVVYNKPSNGY